MDLDIRGNSSHLTYFMLERNIDPSPDDDPYLVLAQDEEEEEDDEVISCWSEDDGDWFLDKAGGDFFNEDELLHDMTEAIHTWGLPKNGDWSTELKTLFEEECEKEVDKP